MQYARSIHEYSNSENIFNLFLWVYIQLSLNDVYDNSFINYIESRRIKLRVLRLHIFIPLHFYLCPRRAHILPADCLTSSLSHTSTHVLLYKYLSVSLDL